MYQFSLHSLEQLIKRNITQEMALWINMILENDKTYLIRVFVNQTKTPL
jgi:hypothetical protein